MTQLRAEGLRTNPRRATVAVTAGVFVGSLGVVAVVLMLAAMASSVGASDVVFSFLIFAVALVGWSLGLFLFGLPLWWLFHRNGWRGRRTAMLLGATTTFSLVLLLEMSGGMLAVGSGEAGSGHLLSFAWACIMAVLGALVALVVWRVAYRQSERAA